MLRFSSYIGNSKYNIFDRIELLMISQIKFKNLYIVSADDTILQKFKRFEYKIR
jgi:CTP:phosphocholine cytidylyltransferase-like protein